MEKSKLLFLLLCNLSLFILCAPCTLFACAAGPAEAEYLPVTFVSSDGTEIEFSANDVAQLKSQTLSTAQHFKSDTFSVPVPAQTLFDVRALVRSQPTRERLERADSWPVQEQFELCYLYDFLLCEGIFEHGVEDARTLYGHVIASREFQESYNGGEEMIPQLTHVMPGLPNIPTPMVHLRARRQTQLLLEHRTNVYCLAFSPNSQTLATGSDDGNVRLWNFAHPVDDPVVLSGHEGWIRCLTFSPDGGKLATGSQGGVARLWDVAHHRELAVLRGHENWITCLAFNPNGSILATGSQDGTARLWNVENPGELVVLNGHRGCINCLAFNLNGKILVTGSDDGTIRIWNVENLGDAPVVLSGNGSGGINCLAMGPNTPRLAAGFDNGTVRIWDTENLSAAPLVLGGHENRVRCLTFNKYGTLLATGSADKTVRIWNVENLGEEPVVLRGHEDDVYSTAFSPHGKILATSSGDRTVKFWDFRSGEELVSFQSEKSAPHRVVFSPDGEMSASDLNLTCAAVWQMWQIDQLPLEIQLSILWDERTEEPNVEEA